MHSERRPTHLSVQRTMSDDAASERVCDLTNMPADTRNYAEELAQLQDKEIKHMRNLKNDKKMDDAERAGHIKDYKQVVALQRFIIMQELKTAVKLAKEKTKGASNTGKGERRPEFITYCTELVEGVPELPFQEMVLLVGKSVRYPSKLAVGFRAGGNGAGAVDKAAQRAWVHVGGKGAGELVLIVLRGEDGSGRVLMPPGQEAPDLLKEVPTQVGASTSKLTTKAVPKGKAKAKVSPTAKGKGKAKAKAVVPGESSDEASLSEEEGEEEEGKGEEEEEKGTAEEKPAEVTEKPEKKGAKSKLATKAASTNKVCIEQYLVYPTYLQSYLTYQTCIRCVSGCPVLEFADTS